jgi:hypothetical protein
MRREDLAKPLIFHMPQRWGMEELIYGAKLHPAAAGMSHKEVLRSVRNLFHGAALRHARLPDGPTRTPKRRSFT